VRYRPPASNAKNDASRKDQMNALTSCDGSPFVLLVNGVKEDGTLSLSGVALRDDYRADLQTMAFERINPGGRDRAQQQR
jgi:hypothetical protein